MDEVKGNVLPVIVTQQQQVESPTANLVLPIRFIGKLKRASVTPSVKNVERWRADNTGAVTIVGFVDGQPGQEISILGDGFTSVANNASVKTNTGATKLLALNKVYRFTMFDIWVEDA